ncbi:MULTISPECIES: SusC/RagA family TonB-linked outer membrane protein [Niastella]|uniref:SusC/RagA family TonB-linked outer membrane protein n=1 Tax=Niastella soli TaxID=2821487 RepID=A0ABS3Z1L8_9BACT|nr:SusC/RagA family TonB-linked outer membrane protein [Niastella soli]MBO9204048.1 SusC/RagA family TonB-linked outer membrane protein [Niastella soli]
MNLQLTKKFSISFVLLLLITVGGFAQVRPVAGQVTDIEGKPVSGVTVTVKGTAGNVITDKEGRYKVMATPEQVIEFTHIAYTSKEVKVGAHPTVDVMLNKTDSQLDDVIVIGYGSQRQKNITGSVVSVNMSKLPDQPVPTITEALRGQIPGVSVNGGSTRPGVMPTLTVRQQFNWGKDGGGSNPLVVIDDVIQTDPYTGLSSMDRLNLLDISEVESITVLRDAAAAIYGTRASQGAIVIKTKRGKIGAPKITYSGKFETTDAVSHGKVMNAYEYGVFANRFIRGTTTPTADNTFSDAELESMKGINYDWLDHGWKAANAMQHSVNVSGGAERATYFMGASYFTQGANLGVNDYNRYTFRAGTDITVANGLKFSAGLGANNSDLAKTFTKMGISDGSYGNGGVEQNDYSQLLHMPKFIPWSVNLHGVDSFISPSLGPNKLGNVNTNQQLSGTNFYALLANGSKQTTKTFGYNANFSMSYEVPWVKGLSFKGTYAIQSNNQTTEQAMLPISLSRNKNGNKAGQHLYTDSTVYDAPVVNRSQTRVVYSNPTGTSEQMNFFVNYDRSFGDHNIAAVVGGEKAKNTYDDRTQLYSQPVPGFYLGTSPTAGTIDPTVTTTTRRISGSLSYLGRVSYAYKGRYLLQFLGRADASTRLAPANYWGFFPSISAGWVLSDENFIRDNLSFVNFLKLRVNFGKTGNDNISPWRWYQNYNIGTDKGMAFGANGGGLTNGITPDVSPNPEIKWDETLQRNFGLDFSVLQNRLSVNVDQYFNTTTNLLTDMQAAVGTPYTVGGGFAELNYSDLKSWGTELNVTWKDKIARKVDYSINMNFGTGNYRTTKYYNQVIGYPGVTETRRSVGNDGYNPVYGYKTWRETSSGDGILRTDEDIDNYWQYLTDNANKSGVTGGPKYGEIIAKSGMKKGMVAYQDLGGALNYDGTYEGPNGIIDKDGAQDYAVIAKTNRTWGVTTNLSFGYKGITLSAQIATSWGGYNQIDYIKNATSSNAGIWSQPIYLTDMYDAVDNPNGKYPGMSVNDWGGTNSDADFWKVSSFRSYVRTMTIGYALPKNLVRRARIDNARVYLSGNNLWDFYNPYPMKYRNMYDSPNVPYPTLRTWALGLNVGF